MIVVQIGTNNGNDHVRDFCRRTRPAKVILVEPFSVHKESILRNYAGIDNVVIEMVAITHDDETRKTMYYATNDDPQHTGRESSYEITSMVRDHLVKHNVASDLLKTFEVDAIQLNKLFERHGLTSIDYLFLDIEGIDFEVLKTIDFKSCVIRNIQIEVLHLNRQELVSFMDANGYAPTWRTFDKYGYDELFTLKSEQPTSFVSKLGFNSMHRGALYISRS